MSLLSQNLTQLVVRHPFLGGIAFSLLGVAIVYVERDNFSPLVLLGVIFAGFGAAMILFHERMFAGSPHHADGAPAAGGFRTGPAPSGRFPNAR